MNSSYKNHTKYIKNNYNIINQVDEYCSNVRLHINVLSKKLISKNKKINYNILIGGLKKYKQALEKDNKHIKDYINKYYNGKYEEAKQFILFFIDFALHFMEIGYKTAKNDK
jgi:aspartyl aminopeptidase